MAPFWSALSPFERMKWRIPPPHCQSAVRHNAGLSSVRAEAGKHPRRRLLPAGGKAVWRRTSLPQRALFHWPSLRLSMMRWNSPSWHDWSSKRWPVAEQNWTKSAGADGSVAITFNCAPGVMLRSSRLARNTGRGQARPRASNSRNLFSCMGSFAYLDG